MRQNKKKYIYTQIEQRVVYNFLTDIKDEEEYDKDEVISVLSSRSSVADKCKSLEDILNNLKRYRKKSYRVSKPRHNHNNNNINNADPAPLPRLDPSKEQQQNQIFESSTWRVMRQLMSADVRNKYPLPKANPDYHFRNATVWQTCGRPPKSTFLLHPDWV